MSKEVRVTVIDGRPQVVGEFLLTIRRKRGRGRGRQYTAVVKPIPIDKANRRG